MKKYPLLAILFLSCGLPAFCQEIQIAAPDGWSKETIKLPPEFAPDMSVKGIEELRFSPDMFDEKAELFFTYVFAFQTESEPQFTQELIEKEMLAYYRGLAAAVSKAKGAEVDTDGFEFSIEQASGEDEQESGPENLARYRCKLKWMEPFVTGKTQTLFIEIDCWQNDESKQNFLFVCASPQQSDKVKIWSQLHKIRDDFYKSLDADDNN